MRSTLLVGLAVIPTFALRPTPVLTRRELVTVGGLAPVLAPLIANAQRQQPVELPDSVETTGVGAERNFLKREPIQPQQWAPVGKLDVNAATVNEYTQFKGLYPSVAGKIASNGPYTSVKDVYKVLDAREAKLFKKYEDTFVALPPGRQFIERINQRQSL